MKAWIVKSFQDTFENAASRKIDEPTYLCLPLAQDSDRFLELMESAHGAMAFGHFVAIVQVLGRLGKRARIAGALISSGRALGPDQLAKRIGAPPKLVRKSWDILASERVGWLKEMAVPTELFSDPNGIDSKPHPPRFGIDSKPQQEEGRQAGTPPNPPAGLVCSPPDFPGFERFWLTWPKHFRKEDKPACLRKWRKSGLEPLADVVIDGLEAWKRCKDWAKDGGAYIPAPHPWLNKRRWEQAAELGDHPPTGPLGVEIVKPTNAQAMALLGGDL